MKNNLFFVLLFSFFAIIFSYNFAFAYICPDYVFNKDLQYGDTYEDVVAIQEILNLDSRTVVALSGPGSKGQETGFFGKATRSSLKRFQALFIEYIGLADGKFNAKTRVSMNAVCKGPFFTNGTGNVFDKATSTSLKDTIPPVIAIAGPTTTDIQVPFRAYIGGNEAIQTPSLTSLIVTNATVGDVRKTSSTTYSFLVTPNQDATDPVTLQVEVDTIKDLAGNTNSKASNEWSTILDRSGLAVQSTDDSLDLSKVLDGITSTLSPATDCSKVTSVDVNDVSNPCYGRAPMSNNSSGGGGGGGGGDQAGQMAMQMLSQLLQAAMKGMGGGGGGQKDAGSSGGQSKGACTGEPTTFLAGKGGKIMGRAGMGMNVGFGNWVDNGIGPAGPIYGFKNYGDAQTCKKQCNGPCMGGCCRPGDDETGTKVMYEIPPSPTHMWQAFNRG
jgi:hypothetical protein